MELFRDVWQSQTVKVLNVKEAALEFYKAFNPQTPVVGSTTVGPSIISALNLMTTNDHTDLAGVFIWSNTSQGSTFWNKLFTGINPYTHQF